VLEGGEDLHFPLEAGVGQSRAEHLQRDLAAQGWVPGQEDLPARAAPQGEIREHEIEDLILEEPERDLAVLGQLDLVPFPAQQALERDPDCMLVLDDEDSGCHDRPPDSSRSE
jgi:hypothetical protein